MLGERFFVLAMTSAGVGLGALASSGSRGAGVAAGLLADWLEATAADAAGGDG